MNFFIPLELFSRLELETSSLPITPVQILNSHVYQCIILIFQDFYQAKYQIFLLLFTS